MDYTSFVPERIALYVFDLDGTLVDSLEDLAHSVNEILGRYGLPPVSPATVRSGVGIGARNLLLRSFAASAKTASSSGCCPGHIAETGVQNDPDPLSVNLRESRYPGFSEIVAEALVPYRAHYEAHCTDHARLYPGMKEWLDCLASRGKLTAVLTNKPEGATRTLLSALGVADSFAVIAGPEAYGALKPDPAGLRAIMAKLGVPNELTAMVGDSSVDIETGRNAGVLTCGITGGLGDEAALRASGPDIIIERV
jgi:phosphoglycolate phosphatase